MEANTALLKARQRLLESDGALTHSEALELARLSESHLFDLIALSRAVTEKHRRRGVYLCGIMSAKTGACSEDCSFCAQSAHSVPRHPHHPMMEPELILARAKEAEKRGVSEFCIVTSGKSPDASTFEKVIEAARLIRRETNLLVGCSLGILSEEQARALASAGVNRYNHNLETSRSFFPNICTTHTFDERKRTCQLVKRHGMELCCGGILGLGESEEQRVELALELREIEPDLVPINFLNPRPNTPLAGVPMLSPFEAIRWIAIMRLLLPKAIIICAGGREAVLGDLGGLALIAGANGIISGNYLTTPGSLPEEDARMLEDIGMDVLRHGT
jgi:biotin synthase